MKLNNLDLVEKIKSWYRSATWYYSIRGEISSVSCNRASGAHRVKISRKYRYVNLWSNEGFYDYTLDVDGDSYQLPSTDDMNLMFNDILISISNREEQEKEEKLRKAIG
jgi:hypothetical protein